MTKAKIAKITEVPYEDQLELVSCLNALRKAYEDILDSGDCGTNSDWRKGDKLYARYRKALKKGGVLNL